jgi:GTPase SAR1 family protein
LKSYFGVKKEVNEIKISVTQEKFLKKSWKVGKKKLHQRKIVPVIIWDFGGQDVFYSTHQDDLHALQNSPKNLDTLTHFYSYL